MNSIENALKKTNEVQFKKIEIEKQKELIDEFVESLVKGLNVKFSDKDELRFIRDKTHDLFFNSTFFNSILPNIYYEIMMDYKRYIPFCYATILTALKNVKDKKYV